MVKSSVDSAKYPASKSKRQRQRTDYSGIYSKEFVEDLDPESRAQIKGSLEHEPQPDLYDTHNRFAQLPRGQLLQEIKLNIEA